MERKLMLIDGNSLLYRAFFALPLLKTSQGVFTNGVYGFFTMFNRVVTEEKPTHIAVAFDKKRESFRNQIYQEYKANRSAPPDELRGQFELLRQVLKARNVMYIEKEDYEADDIIGTLSRRAEAEGIDTVILTGDSDTLQLVTGKVQVLMTKKGISEMDKYDIAKVQEKWEVSPEQMVEIKGLMGDTSDNIPGVPGVGAKTAIKLIKEFGNLEGLYNNLHLVKGKKLADKLKEYREQAFLSRQLGRIITDMEINCQIDDFKVKPPDIEALKNCYKELELNSFLRDLEQMQPEVSVTEVQMISQSVREINSPRDIDKIIETGGQSGLSILLQCNSHHPMWALPEVIYLGCADEIFYLDLREATEEKISWLKTCLETPAIPKYLHNAKFVQVLMLRYGISLGGVKGDTMLMAYVIDPVFDGSDLTMTLYRYLNLSVDHNDYVLQVGKIKELFCCLEQIADEELKMLYYEVELPLSAVLAQMEYCGITVDPEVLIEISDELLQRITKDEQMIYDLAGSEFNINSPKQLGKILFEDLGLRVVKKTKTGYATGAEILEELYEDHDIIPLILEYRQLSKLRSTYTESLQGCIHPQTCRVHTIFKQAQTATGRLSSIEPNLQNIPVRMEEGRRIRRAFIARDDKHVILSADYSQIDLRSLAHISKDENLIATFQAGIDIHTRTAAEIFHVPIGAVTPELRYRAKAVNFGIIYGISDFGLARDTGVSRKEAKMYIENYLNSYPGVRRYMDDIVEFGKKYGYVETILKRRRYLPDLNSSNKILQSFARRMALNTPIQGTSADIIKLAMINIARELETRQLNAQILLQVHDDLILEVPKSELNEVAELMVNCMENAYKLEVPLLVSLKMGSNWYDMQEIELPRPN